MATRYITCTKKESGCTEEHEIIGAGGTWGYAPKAQIHDQIKAGTHTYYSQAPGVTDVLVEAEGSGASRYIRTRADKTKLNNLVKLKNCPS